MSKRVNADMKQFGFRALKVRRVPTKNLHFQYVPALFNSDFWPAAEGMDVEHSPHVDLLRIYDESGMDWPALMDSKFARQLKYWDSIGYTRVGGKRRNDTYLRQKISAFVKLYRSIKRKGYRQKPGIIVLNAPIWRSRYGASEISKRFEIWHGHHRAAACFHSGVQSMHCHVFSDNRSGTKKCPKIDRRVSGLKTHRG
jgi:hypothetical protein